jgi:hypothetical protein
MAVIVFVHGIAQEQLSADLLEKDWLPGLAGGVRTAGFPQVADRIWRDSGSAHTNRIEARMAFYGNLFLQTDQQGAGDEDIPADEVPFAEALAQVWLERAADQARDERDRRTAQQELAELRGEAGIERQGVKGRVAASAIRGLSRLRWFAPFGMGFAQRFVNRTLSQVTRYLGDETIRRTAQRRVLDLVGPETRVLIGHSLGSVVAYETAWSADWPGDHPLPLLLTLGSPLGIRNLVYDRLRPQPPAFPPRVLRWVNVAAPDDLVAAVPDLTPGFSAGMPEGATFEGGRMVDNGSDPHNGLFYLGKKSVAQAIGQVFVDAP